MLLVRDKKFYKNLLILGIPIMLQGLITFCVGLADNVMIGTLGDSAVSGVYMGNQIQTVLQMISGGIEATILLLSAQYWGKKDPASIKKIISVGMSFALLFGLVLTLVCALFPEWTIGIFTNEESVIKSGAEYLSIVCYSYVFFCITQGLIAAMRSVESTRIGMIVSACSLVVNVCLNYILIFGKLGIEPMGVRGAAIATLIARIAETAIIFVYVRFVDKKLGFRVRSMLHLDKTLLRDFVRYGLPLMAGNVVWGCNLFANSVILGHFTESVITATSVANTLNSLIFVCMTGLSAAAGIQISKMVGAGDVSNIRAYANTVQILFLALGILTGGLFLLICEPYIAMYSISAEAAMYTRQFIRVLSVTAIGTCYQAGSLQGLVKSGGDVSFVFKNDTIFVFCIVLPSAIITALCGCAPWIVFLCLKSDQILKCVVAFFKIRKYDWMKNLTR